MATLITKNSQTASAVPSAGSLSTGELAVNTADARLYTKHSDGTVKQIKVATADSATTATNVSGTVAVANGGTGATSLTANNVLLGNGTSAIQAVAPGTSGNILTSNGTTWVSQAPSGGGVTSLNGQTGAITDTTAYAIGSYITGRPANGNGYTVNSTIAGSSLYATACNSSYINGSGWSNAVGQTLINTGSWRCMSPAPNFYNKGAAQLQGNSGLWVRYA